MNRTILTAVITFVLTLAFAAGAFAIVNSLSGNRGNDVTPSPTQTVTLQPTQMATDQATETPTLEPGDTATSVPTVEIPTATPIASNTPTRQPTTEPTTIRQPTSVVQPTTAPTRTRSATPVPTRTATRTPTLVPTRTRTATRVPTRTSTLPPPPATRTPVITAWRGEYYSNRDLSGAPLVVRNDESINFNWGAGAPSAGLPTDNFSARWTRTFAFEAGQYRFHTFADDGVRVYVDGNLVINEWRDGGARERTADLTLPAGNHNLRVEFYERAGDALIGVWWDKVTSFPEWRGEYFNNAFVTGSPVVVRNDSVINFNWGSGAPNAALPNDYFSARWTHTTTFNAGTYRFHVIADDGARVWIDNQLIIDEWRTGNARESIATVTLARGAHSVRVEYFEATGGALVRFWWEQVQPTATATVTRTATRTSTATVTNTPRPSRTPTRTPTNTPRPTRTRTLTPTATLTASRTPTNSPTRTPRPTRTLTATPTATATPLATTVHINEILPVTGKVDWNKDGVKNNQDEWIELYNAGSTAVDLAGWSLDDSPAPGTVNDEDRLARPTLPYRIPNGTVLQPGAYMVFYRKVTGINLNDRGDQVRLIDRNGTLVERVTFGALKADASYSRDAKGKWHKNWPPSPGAANEAPKLMSLKEQHELPEE